MLLRLKKSRWSWPNIIITTITIITIITITITTIITTIIIITTTITTITITEAISGTGGSNAARVGFRIALGGSRERTDPGCLPERGVRGASSAPLLSLFARSAENMPIGAVENRVGG